MTIDLPAVTPSWAKGREPQLEPALEMLAKSSINEQLRG